MKALYREAFRQPPRNRMHYIPPTWIASRDPLGDPNLLAEKVATINLGVSYENRRIPTGITYFHSRQTDGIVLADVTPNGHHVNSGRTLFQGVEFEAKDYLRNGFFLTGSASYQTNHDAVNVAPLANRGAQAGASYASPGGLTASLFDVYRSAASNPPRAPCSPSVEERAAGNPPYILNPGLPPSLDPTCLSTHSHF